MEAICKELDETKATMQKLMADYHVKIEISESLRKAHDEQLVKINETKLQMEKQARELTAKAEEIALAKQMYEDLKSSFRDRESMLKHLSSTTDQLRSSCGEKLQKLEGENRELVSALNEMKAKCEDQELTIRAYKEEVEGLKRVSSVSEKKCFNAEQRVQTAEVTIKQMASQLEIKTETLEDLSKNKIRTDDLRTRLVQLERNLTEETSQRVAAQRALEELRRRDDLLLKLEQDIGKLGDQLKWKREQFGFLEQAHKKLQDQFQISKIDWEAENTRLLDEICSLQSNLESQTRILEDVRSQLQVSNQALAHAESRRTMLEMQVNESQVKYENVSAEYQEARSKIESLAIQRDEEIASLRSSLATKEALFKEMKFKQTHLEQENQELHYIIKELQEARINDTGTANSLSKLRQKLKGLEQVHRDCSRTLKSKEAEWSSLTEKLVRDLEDCKSDLDSKHNQIQELQSELESCQSSWLRLMLQNEETSMTLLVFRSEFSQVLSTINSFNPELETCSEKKDGQIALLNEQLEIKNCALVKAQAEIDQEIKIKEALLERVQSTDVLEQQCLLMQKELEELSKCRDCLQQQDSEKGEDLKRTAEALEKANSDLDEKTCRLTETEFELQRCKEIVEQLQVAKIYAEIKSKTYKYEIEELQREREAVIIAYTETKESFKQEKTCFLRISEERNKKLEDLQRKILLLEQEITRSSETAANLKLESRLSEINRHFEILEKKQQITMDDTASAMILAELEIQSRNRFIDEHEEEIESLKQKMELQGRLLFDSKQLVDRLEVEIERHRNEEGQLDTLKAKLGLAEETLKEQNARILSLQEDLEVSQEVIGGLLTEREELVDQMARFSERMEEFCCQDAHLMKSFGSILEMVTNENEHEIKEDIKGEALLTKPEISLKQEASENILSSSKQKQEGSPGRRSPLKVLNS